MKAIIPAAGYATRLYPLTKSTPKPLLKVGQKRMLEHVINKLEHVKELDEIHIVTNNRFYHAFDGWMSGFRSRKKLYLHNDGTNSNDDRLGTMGDIHYVLEKAAINDDVIIINADNLFEFSLEEMVKLFHKNRQPVVAFRDMGDPAKLARKFGVGLIDETSRIIDFEEKPRSPKSSLASTGVYIFTAHCMDKLRRLINENPGDRSLCDKSGHFIQHLMLHKPIYAFTFDEMWYDIGGFDELREAHKLLGGGNEYDTRGT